MKANCATDLPCLLARRLAHLPELLDEDARTSLGDVLVYDSFGNLTMEADAPTPFSYLPLDQDPCEGMQAAQARCYDPTPGRWIQKDSIGFAAGDANLYRYVNTEARGILLNEDGTLRDA